MGVLDYVEYGLAKILSAAKGHDDKLFVKGPAFQNFPQPTLQVECPECGPSGSMMKLDHTPWGTNKFPELKWSSNLSGIKEYLLVVEDPDAPLPTPPVHGIFYSLPSTMSEVTADDFEKVKNSEESNRLKGGFKHGSNVRGTKYGGPRPLLAHGPHRYWYSVIALSEQVDATKLTGASKKGDFADAVAGKVLGWGAWVGVYERKWS